MRWWEEDSAPSQNWGTFSGGFYLVAVVGEWQQSAKSGQKQSSNNVVPVNSFGVLSYALGRICHDQR